MKRLIKEIDTTPFYNVLLHTGDTCSISIDEDDVTNLFENATSLSFLVTNGDSLKDALKRLDPKELDFDKAKKAIFLVRYSQAYPMTASDLSELGRYINESVSKADVRWGLATNKESKENVTLVVATTY